MSRRFDRTPLALAVAGTFGAAAFALTPSVASAAKPVATYVAGDFHNHTTCSDGSISMQKLIKKVTDKTQTPWGLDWFVQSGHGGSGNRNCTLAEDATLATPAYPLAFAADGITQQGPTTTWQNSNPSITPKGLVSGSTPNQVMWRWQSIQEYQYPMVEYFAAYLDKPLFIGVETVAPGHEHVSMSVIDGQTPNSIYKQTLPTTPGYTAKGNANALAQWEYCFDRSDTDTSRGDTTVGSGVGNNWDCSVPGSANASDPSWNATAQKLIPASGTGSGVKGDAKSQESMKWLAQYHGDDSYYIPAHLERAGPFNPDGNNGYNIENLRNYNNLAPNTAFGFETQPGHGASDARGEYTVHRNNINGTNVDSVGGTTYGGTGVYGAQVGGVWDALLGEGRNFFFFASSDWHNRGIFGPDDRRSSQDFYPGEYQRTYVMVEPNAQDGRLKPQKVVDGLRTGNAFSSSGQLIDRLAFVACYGIDASKVKQIAENAALTNTAVSKATCATMGQHLQVPAGSDVIVAITTRDPDGANFSPYTFNNPSLLQVGIERPINKPVLDHIDIIDGLVTGLRSPEGPDYAGAWPADWISNPNMDNVPAAAKNTSAAVVKTFAMADAKPASGNAEFKTVAYKIKAPSAAQYIRLRGSNMPASVPFETDANGNPLADLYTNNGAINPTVPGGSDGKPAGANLKIPCTTVGTTEYDGCPSHLGTVEGKKMVSYDIAAWSDLWFYSNPIFIEVGAASKDIAQK
jgi:hypothetical protein